MNTENNRVMIYEGGEYRLSHYSYGCGEDRNKVCDCHIISQAPETALLFMR